MTFRYITALGIIALLSCTAYYSLSKVIETEETSAAVINVSGRQRMLCERIAFLSGYLVHGDERDDRDGIRRALRETIDLMERSHEGLINGDPTLKLLGNPSRKVRSMYFDSPMSVDLRIRAFIHDARMLANIDDDALDKNNPHLVRIIDSAKSELIDDLNKIVKQYQRESEETIAKLQLFESVVLGLTLLVLLGVGLFIFRPMAKRIRREAQGLKDSEKKIRAIVDTAGEGIVTIDGASCIQFVNEEFCNIFGYREEELLNHTLLTLMPEKYRNGHVKGMERYLRGESSRIKGRWKDWLEIEGLRKDRTIFPLELRVNETRISGYESALLTASIRDITERKQAEEKIKSLARFPDENPHAVIRVSKEGDILYANEASRPLLEMWKCKEGTPFPEEFGSLVLGGLDLSEEKNTEITCNERVYVLSFWNIPESGYTNVYGQDITERRKAEKALQESHGRLIAVLESLDAIVYVTDIETYEIYYANKYLKDLVCDDIVGKTCRKILYGGQSGACEMCKNTDILDANGFPSEVKVWEFKSRDSAKWYDVRARAIRWVDGRTVRLLIATDMTERKNLMLKLAKANEEVKSFANIVSHDLRSPLVNLKGFSHELKISCGDIKGILDEVSPFLTEVQRKRIEELLQDDITEALDFIDSSTSTMERLIGHILVLSRIGRRELHFEKIETTGIIGEKIKTLQHQVKSKGIKIEIKELPAVIADESSLEQIFGNLLSNAINYLVPERPGEVEISGRSRAEDDLFIIKDNGRGIAEEDRHKVFAIFRRAGKQDVPGEGMGLAYVKVLVERHGGEIWFESEEELGTTFYFTLRKNLIARSGIRKMQ